MREPAFVSTNIDGYFNASNRVPRQIFWFANILIVAGLLLDLLTPFLIWKGFLPSFTRWISSAIIMIVIAVLFLQMIVTSRIPAAILVIFALSTIGITVAQFNNQQILATLWGWWLMFKYPLVGIYIYVQPSWTERTSKYIVKACIALLTFEVCFQIGQYLMGERPGDDLVGTFGRHETQPLLSFTVFVLCLALGQWIAQRRWRNFVWVMILCVVSGILSETKFFLPASFLLIALSILVSFIQNGQLIRSIPNILLVGVSLFLFIFGYDALVPGASRTPIEKYISDRDSFDSYSNMEYRMEGSSTYYMGRTRAVLYAWDSIVDNPVTLLFGMGIGARGESRSLGINGVAFNGVADKYTRVSSLVVLMQEMGLLGLVTTCVFIVWVVYFLLGAIKKNPQSPLSELRYALVLFSFLWPLWMYYATVWNQEVVMTLYWALLGYLCAKSNHKENVVGPLLVSNHIITDKNKFIG